MMNYKKDFSFLGKRDRYTVFGKSQLLLVNVFFITLLIMTICFASKSTWASSVVYTDEVIVVPYTASHWGEKILIRDDSGVFDNMKGQVDSWVEKEEYAKNWNMESTGLYEGSSEDEKKDFFMTNGLKYMDKRLAGEVRHAEEGSTLHRVGQVQKAMQPAAKVNVSKNVGVKFKAKVLQMEGRVTVVNPYIDSHVNYSYTKNETNVHVGRDISSMGIGTGVDYKVQKQSWEAYMSKRLTETISTKVSSAQSQNRMAFSQDSDRKVEVNYSRPF